MSGDYQTRFLESGQQKKQHMKSHYLWMKLLLCSCVAILTGVPTFALTGVSPFVSVFHTWTRGRPITKSDFKENWMHLKKYTCNLHSSWTERDKDLRHGPQNVNMCFKVDPLAEYAALCIQCFPTSPPVRYMCIHSCLSITALSRRGKQRKALPSWIQWTINKESAVFFHHSY